jgi:hypothetical protein
MQFVVNHLHLRDPMPQELVEKAQEAVRSVRDAGDDAAHVAKVNDRHIVFILMFDSPETPPESRAKSVDRGWARTSCRCWLA